MEKLMVTHRLSLDMSNQAVQATITLAQYDTATHRLIVSLRNGAEVVELPPGSYAVAVQNPDAGVDVLDSVTVYGADSVFSNCIVYDVNEAVTAIEGMHEAQFLITYMEGDALRQLSSPRIAFVVKPDIMRSSDVENSSSYGAVVVAQVAAETASKEAVAAQAAAETAKDEAQKAQTAAEAVGVVESVTVQEDGKLQFDFKDGRTITTDRSVKGQDGHTPIKGTDYWTDVDKQEIVDEVLDSISKRIFVYDNTSLLNAISIADEGTTIVLFNDIELETGSITITKSIVIDGNGHKITTTFNNYLFNVRTTTENSFLTMKNVDVTHSHMVVNVNSGYYADITIENATFTGLTHLVYFRPNSEGSLTVKNVTSENMNATAIYTSGTNSVSIIDSTISSLGHAVQVEHYGSTIIEGSTIQSTQKDFTIVCRAPDNNNSLTINNSRIENNSTGDGYGCAIYYPYGRKSMEICGDTYISGKLPILSALIPYFEDDYTGAPFMLRYDNNCYYFYDTLDAAIAGSGKYAVPVYAITAAARTVATNAGYSVTLDSTTGYYVVS